MPKVSFIVAAHNSERFLPTCLDSILGQSFHDFELIAADDASTDGSAPLLDSYAAKDDRVRVIHLEGNVGAGGARNAALEQATGDYVWCIDSDDWIVPDALATAMQELDRGDADVLLIGFTRIYPDGTLSVCSEMKTLEAAPPSFRLHEWPTAVHILHTPWNKIVRRELVVRTGFRFPSGWHQDLPYTYTMLSAAGRVSALPKSLVMYRQHLDAATVTKSSGHLCILDQWSLTFDLVDRHGPRPDLLRPHLIDRMLWHLSEQLKKHRRLPAEAWPEFARRAAALWRARAPKDYSFPRGLTGLKYRLIARHPRLVPLIPRLFALRKSLRGAAGVTRGWDLSPERLSRSKTSHSSSRWAVKS